MDNLVSALSAQAPAYIPAAPNSHKLKPSVDQNAIGSLPDAPLAEMPQTLLVMVGLMGSGKTTLGERLVTRLGAKQCVRFSQDMLGSRQQVVNRVRAALQKGTPLVIVDRTNFDQGQREHWTQLAKEFDVRCIAVVMTVSSETCIERLVIRRNHEAKQQIFPREPHRIRGLIKQVKTNWRAVVGSEEGFALVIKCADSRNDQLVLNLIIEGGNEAKIVHAVAVSSALELEHELATLSVSESQQTQHLKHYFQTAHGNGEAEEDDEEEEEGE